MPRRATAGQQGGHGGESQARQAGKVEATVLVDTSIRLGVPCEGPAIEMVSVRAVPHIPLFCGS